MYLARDNDKNIELGLFFHCITDLTLFKTNIKIYHCFIIFLCHDTSLINMLEATSPCQKPVQDLIN
jgi:hypothetical protein